MSQPSFWRIIAKQFWALFGGVWLLVGLVFLGVSASESSEPLRAVIFGAFGIIFAGGGGFAFIKGLNRARNIVNLFRTGTRGQGTVAAVVPTNVRINGVAQWVVQYRYYDGQGQRREAKSDYLAFSLAEKWQEGDIGIIYYDQNKPELSYWVGREEI